jgi:hypothetical protein
MAIAEFPAGRLIAAFSFHGQKQLDKRARRNAICKRGAVSFWRRGFPDDISYQNLAIG